MARTGSSHTGPSRRRRTAASSRARPIVTQPRPLAPAPAPSSAQNLNPIIDTNIDPRLQGVTITDGIVADDDDQDMQEVSLDPAFEADLRAGNGDVDWAAAVSGLLLLGATTGQPPVPSQSDATIPSTIPITAQEPSGPSTRASRKNNGAKRQKLEASEPEKPVPPVAELSIHSFNNRRAVTRVQTAQFNIFQTILQHVHIFFHFVACLDVDGLVSLYAISKDLHNMVNTANTAVILAQAMHYAPKAASIFPFRCYRKLCNDDPRVDLDLTRGQSRLIPSFRWLRMVHWRDQIAHKIVSLLNEEGLYLPVQAETAVKKIWFLMDVPDNQRRLALIQNPELWSISNLFYSIMFFLRIDMRCTGPLATRTHGNIRRMLMAQPSMTMLCRVLERKFLLNKQEAMQTYMRWKFTARNDQQPNVFGVPQEELGLLQYEGYGKEGSRVRLQRPDELILKECVRRGLKMETAFFCMLNCTGPRPPQSVVATAAAATADDDDATMILDEADQ